MVGIYIFAVLAALAANVANQISAPRYAGLIAATIILALISIVSVGVLFRRSPLSRWLLVIPTVLAALPLIDLMLRFGFGMHITDLVR